VCACLCARVRAAGSKRRSQRNPGAAGAVDLRVFVRACARACAKAPQRQHACRWLVGARAAMACHACHAGVCLQGKCPMCAHRVLRDRAQCAPQLLHESLHSGRMGAVVEARLGEQLVELQHGMHGAWVHLHGVGGATRRIPCHRTGCLLRGCGLRSAYRDESRTGNGAGDGGGRAPPPLSTYLQLQQRRVRVPRIHQAGHRLLL
jgi:hypothetical protein